MERKEVLLKGMNRSQLVANDGDCHEIINIRRKNGQWVSIKPKVTVKTVDKQFDVLYAHKADTLEVLVGYSKITGKLYQINSNSDVTIWTFAPNLAIRFGCLGNVLIVYDDTNTKTHYLLYRIEDAAYKYIGDPMPNIIAVDFVNDTSGTKAEFKIKVHIGTVSDNRGEDTMKNRLVGGLMKGYAKWKEDGWFNGFMVARTAYELFDGSYIGFSEPKLIYIRDQYGDISPNLGTIELIYSDHDDTIPILPGRLKYKIEGDENLSIITTLKDRYKDIIKGLAIFISKPVDRFNENSFPAKYWNDEGVSYWWVKNIVEDPDITPDSVLDNLLYKVKSISIDELSLCNSDDTIIKENLLEIHTKDTMPIEGIAHTLFSNFAMTYNSRIWLSKITTIFNRWHDPKVLAGFARALFGASGDPKTTVLEYKIKTSQGNVYLRSNEYINEDRFISLPNLLYYPDDRAIEFRILVKPDGESDFKVCFTHPLIPHSTYNYAYGILGDLDDLQNMPPTSTNDKSSSRSRATDIARFVRDWTKQVIWMYPADYASLPIASEISISSLVDGNRVQASEIGNPFMYLAKNSYQVGTGDIKTIAANTVPLSELQFGEHPVFVFSDSGIWALELGVGDILVTRVIPVSSDVCNSPMTASVSNVIFFSTIKGLHAIHGRDVKHVSLPLEGEFATPIADDLYAFTLGHLFAIDPTCKVSFQDYLAGAILIADYANDELLVCNSAYNYTYVLNVKDGVWYKRAEKFAVTCSSWPKSYAIQSNKIVEITAEAGATMPLFFETRDMNMDNYSKLQRLTLKAGIQRKSNSVNTIFALYGSGRPESNHLISNVRAINSGVTLDEIVLSGSSRSGRYFRFVFGGDLDSFIMGRMLMDTETRWTKL